METFGIIIQIGIFVTIIISPIIILRKNKSFIKTNLLAIPIISLLVIIGSYWPHFYKDIRLVSMGVNVEGMNKAERTINVEPELKEKAEELYWSLMGIGWPLKAIFGIVLFVLYPSILYIVNRAWKQLKQ